MGFTFEQALRDIYLGGKSFDDRIPLKNHIYANINFNDMPGSTRYVQYKLKKWKDQRFCFYLPSSEPIYQTACRQYPFLFRREPRPLFNGIYDGFVSIANHNVMMHLRDVVFETDGQWMPIIPISRNRSKKITLGLDMSVIVHLWVNNHFWLGGRH